MLNRQSIKEYNRSRVKSATTQICHAPTSSMNFEQGGAVTACCYNREHVFGSYPTDKLEAIWFGDMANQLREAITKNDLSRGCHLCEQQIQSGNFENTRAKGFDSYASKKNFRHWLEKFGYNSNSEENYPQVLEFELDNTCNLECKMCSGKFSSLIRKNRENLPPLENVYDDQFVDQLEKFIPHITEAKFLGGEPFLIPIYWKIWERIIALNPKATIHITTNGTILSERIKSLLHKMKPNIVISIDSLIASSYEHIRQNANFEKVWENVSYFRSFTNTYEKDLSFAVCPMTLNWQEVPDILQYCNENNIGLYLNTVTHPKKYSLYDLNPTSLKEVLDVVQATVFLDSTPIQKVNNLAYKSFVASLASTYKEIVSSYDLTMANFKSLSNNTSDELSQLLITYNAALYEQKTYESDNSSVDNHQLSTLYCQLKKTPDIIVKSYGHLLLDFLDAFGKSTDHTKRLEENLDGLLAFLLADQNIDYFERLMLIDLNDVLRLLTRTESKVFKERLYQNNYVEQWLNSRN